MKYFVIKNQSDDFYHGDYGIASWGKEVYSSELYSTIEDAEKIIKDNFEEGIYQIQLIYIKRN